MKKPAGAVLKKLAEKAREAVENAVAPFSNFRVGAALITAGGRVYTGCNIENPSLSMSVCAEKVALMKALSEGEREFVAIAIFADGMEYCPPCGSCRQLLYEFAPEILVVMAGVKDYRVEYIKSLLPGAFEL